MIFWYIHITKQLPHKLMNWSITSHINHFISSNNNEYLLSKYQVYNIVNSRHRVVYFISWIYSSYNFKFVPLANTSSFPPTLILISSFSPPDLPYTTPALILGDSSKYVDWYLQYAGHLVPWAHLLQKSLFISITLRSDSHQLYNFLITLHPKIISHTFLFQQPQ